MKASYNWLRSLVPGLSASPREVAERLTRSGLEVEEVIEYGAPSASVVVAVVRKIDPHPARERLKLVTVDRGGALQQVVCGASNVPAPGGKVVLAPLGVHLPAVDVTVADRAIGGIVSQGMLCSENELGLVSGTGKGDGILVLPEDLQVAPGTTLVKALPATHDFVLDIAVSPNRPDALGHVGIARELAALFDVAFTPPSSDAPLRVATGSKLSELASVAVEDTDRCPHYGAALLVDVKVSSSPLWLRYRLEGLSVRSISNVVDATNLVLLEYCQPLHAFDLDKLPGGRIVVRTARAGEKLTTLDGVERALDRDDLVISDGVKPIALAGVMGGGDSEIGNGTARVLLECAYFSPRGIRRSSRRHGLHTEASHRFERGCDPEHVPEVLVHAAALLTRLSGAAAVPGQLLAGVPRAPRAVVRYRQARAIELLGFEVALDDSVKILKRLGCDAVRSSSGELAVTVPSFRPDLKREEDLIDEVMRIHGIDAVPAVLRPVPPAVGRSTPPFEACVRTAAAELGLSEALIFGFTSPAELAAIGAPPACVTLENPLSEEHSVMRTSLLPGLFDALRRARRRGVRDVRLFAVGSIFVPGAAGSSLPEERPSFAALLAGARPMHLGTPEACDIYDAKGVAVELIRRTTPERARIEPGGAPHLHPRGAGRIVVAGREVGRIGPIHPDVVAHADLNGECLVVEIDLHALSEAEQRVPQYQPIPQLPAVTRDLALLVREDVSAGALGDTIARAAGELCESVELFDLYRAKGLPDDHKSLAYRIVFRDPKAATDPERARTLTDAEVDARTREVIDVVTRTMGASVRV